jgi:Uma2 family endonuclease
MPTVILRSSPGGTNVALTKADKPAGTWTYKDLFALPDDGKRYEIIEGELYEMPAPNLDHATVIANIIALLIPLVTQLGGRWYTAPVDVFFQGADPVQPDVMVIFPGWQGSRPKRGLEGAPDLLVEVLSPSNRGHDILTKRALYARGGVREYWIVDPDARTLEILTFDRGDFHQGTVSSGSDTPISALFGPLPIEAGDLFANLDE